jgi:hypothetical protein
VFLFEIRDAKAIFDLLEVAGMHPRKTSICLLLAGLLIGISIALMIARNQWEQESQFFETFTPLRLPPTEQKLLEYLLLLPISATIVCFCRIVIGLATFGTFAPALLGLAFREMASGIGIFVFLSILFAGWFLRHAVNRLHLLQIPRTSLMLSLVIGMLVCFVLVSNSLQISASQYIPLFPLVILTGMIERFWTVDEEEGTKVTLIMLFGTLGVCGAISLLLRFPPLVHQMLGYPETLGIVMAIQILLGRYTGYRLLELYRFRELLKDGPCSGSLAVND